MERRTVALAGGTVAYVDSGDGPVAFFVHGVFLNADLWRNVISALGEERRCIAVDLPCHGATALPDDADLSLPALADLLEELCASLNLGPIDLVGNDTGGAVCQVWATHHPERLRSLTLTNCDCHDNLPPEAFRPIVDLAAAGQLAPVVQAMAADLNLAKSEAGLGSGYQHPEDLPDEVVRSFLTPLIAHDGGISLERFLTAVRAEDLLAIEPALEKLEAPTLVAWGTADQFFEIKWAHWLRDTIPGVQEIVEVDGAKLFFPDERADELVPHLERHWARAAAAPAAEV